MAANVARFKVDVHARVTTTWTHQHSEPGCQDGTTETEYGNGTQTLSFSAVRRPVKFTFFGPGQAQFRTSPINLRGKYVATRKGSMVTNDPGLAASRLRARPAARPTRAVPASSGCGRARPTPM